MRLPAKENDRNNDITLLVFDLCAASFCILCGRSNDRRNRCEKTRVVVVGDKKNGGIVECFMQLRSLR